MKKDATSLIALDPLPGCSVAGAAVESQKGRVLTRAHDPQPGEQTARERVAFTLNLGPQSVTIDQWRFSGVLPSILHCRGTAAGKRFFAKVFLADPYPILPRISLPWEETRAADSTRSVEGQIETECEVNQFLRATLDGKGVPAVLGKSRTARTIVWEEVRGIRLDHLLARPGWSPTKKRTVAEALLRAGMWLRRVHDATFRQYGTQDAPKILARLRRLADEARPSSVKYARHALLWIEAAQRSVASGPLISAAVAFNHGDFSLPNLLWDIEGKQLIVVDFEHAGYRSVCQDLLTLVYDLRVHLLNPFAPSRLIRSSEAAFWEGYGSIPVELVEFIRAVASARIFFYFLPRLASRKEQGWAAKTRWLIYRAFFEDFLIRRRLSTYSSARRQA